MPINTLTCIEPLEAPHEEAPVQAAHEEGPEYHGEQDSLQARKHAHNRVEEKREVREHVEATSGKGKHLEIEF